MSVINLAGNASTLTLNGYTFTSFQEGDFIILNRPNAVTDRANSTANGVSIQERSDADVGILTINVQKNSLDHAFLIQQANQRNPATIFAGSLAEQFTEDGVDKVRTFTLEVGTVTTRGDDTRNSQTPNDQAQYVIEFRTAIESL